MYRLGDNYCHTRLKIDKQRHICHTQYMSSKTLKKVRKKPGPKIGSKQAPIISIDDNLDKIQKMASIGLNQSDIATLLGIKTPTLSKYLREHPEFYIAYKKGRVDAKAMVTNKLFDKIRQGDVASIFFYLKCQCKWRETNRHELTGKNGGPIRIDANKRADDYSLSEMEAHLSKVEEAAEAIREEIAKRKSKIIDVEG